MTKSWCCLIALATFAGCDRGSPAPVVKKVASPAQANTPARGETIAVAGNNVAKKVMRPKFEMVQIGVFDGKEGDESGCSTGNYRPVPDDPKLKVKMSLNCGPVGKSSKVAWDYLRTDEAGDHYQFERVFPVEGPMTTTSTKEIVYVGKEQIVFQDEFQRVVIRPQPDRARDMKFKTVMLRVEKKEGPGGCEMDFSPAKFANDQRAFKKVECGIDGNQIKCEVDYVRTTDAGDYYSVTRLPDAKRSIKPSLPQGVVFAGKRVVVFEEDVLRFVMLPEKKNTDELKK